MKNLNLKIGSDFLYLDIDEMLKQVEMHRVNKEGEKMVELNLPKFEFFKTILDTACNIVEDVDDTLGVISLNKLAVSSKLAINTLIKYKIIKKIIKIMEQGLEQLKNALDKLKDKDFNIYFLTQDTNGNATASVALNYQYVKYLHNEGYKTHILYEKKEYKGVKDWLGEDYSDLPHANIEEGALKVGPADIVVVPEIFGHVLEQIVKMPCTKLIFSQSYDYILETLNPGFGWSNYGVTKCITTSKKQEEYIKKLFPTVQTTIIEPSIPNYFIKSEKPKKPIIAIHTREPRDTMKLIKSFYLQNPQFKWITFRDMRNLSRKEFAQTLGECCASIWVDRISSFGTFPIESMMCNTPVIGALPIMKPDWLTNENGIWVFDESQLVEIVSNFMKNWLEDSVPENLYVKMSETAKSFSTEERERVEVVTYFGELVKEKISELEFSINKLTPVGENS